MWIAIAVVVVAVWALVGGVYMSGSSVVCNACHEMRPAVATWRTSAHAQVECPACHQSPRPASRFPEMLAERASLMQRDFGAHFSGDTSIAPIASMTTTSTISDETCLHCHDLSREVTVRSDVIIKHAEHAKRNKSCVSCHLWTAHPVPETERPLLLMARCFTCHGRTADAKAPGTCETCHSGEFEARPESHRSASWRTKHGKASQTKAQPCDMCHEPSFCTNCHGLQMPHPADWVKGKPGHSTVGAANRQVCAQCHTEKPDLCSMCHHKDQQPANGPWVDQHPEMVRKRGASFCFECHKDVFCYDCHTKRRKNVPPTPTVP
jgi:hypothetical protein